ncbi:urate hydroxylase PuuD [Candidatus Puniceispirillum sp.]|nr:urate hydroxylase PuuD [Candidatus Puniceispirillum sp.]
MVDYLWMWSELVVRWVHVIAGIAWIGSSFYFIALDLSLRPGKELPDEAHGQAWQVHGGGFYNMVKYLVAPAKMPDELTWFKWEAYGTWVSGIALMSLVYYGAASLYMIDLEILDITETQAVMISLVGIVIGWVFYDGMCRSPLSKSDLRLALAGFVFLVLLAYGYGLIFSARGAFMQMGVTIGTMMVANVLMVIIPGQTKVVTALKAGEQPDPRYGARGKQRSLHNNYLTLPVIFVMIGGHYPAVFATDYAWAILALILVIGAVIRHFFNTKHKGLAPPWWTWIVAGLLTGCAIMLSQLGAPNAVYDRTSHASPEALNSASIELVIERCSSCHAREPVWDGLAFAPKGIYLESEGDVLRHTNDIFWQVAASHAMPPGQVIWIEDEERAMLAVWRDMVNHGLVGRNK